MGAANRGNQNPARSRTKLATNMMGTIYKNSDMMRPLDFWSNFTAAPFYCQIQTSSGSFSKKGKTNMMGLH
jgi:hypothetical protein